MKTTIARGTSFHTEHGRIATVVELRGDWALVKVCVSSDLATRKRFVKQLMTVDEIQARLDRPALRVCEACDLLTTVNENGHCARCAKLAQQDHGKEPPRMTAQNR